MKRLYESWLKLDDKIRFVFIGGVNALISYIIFALFIICLGEEHHQLCVMGQWVFSSIPSYLNQRFFVFNTKGNYIKEYLKCCSTWVVSYFFNVIILELLVRFLIKNVYIAQMVSIVTVSIITYVLFKYFAFKVKKN